MGVVRLVIFVLVELVPTLRPLMFVREREPRGFVARLRPVLLGIVSVLLQTMAVPVTTLMGFVPVAPFVKVAFVWMRRARVAAIFALKVHFATEKGSAFRILVNPFTPTGFVKTRL